MKRGLSFLVATFAVSILMLPASRPALAAKSPKAPKSFQAQITVQAGSDSVEHGTMYYSHGRIREEMTPAGGGPRIVTIIDPTRKSMYVIEANKKAFRVLPWDTRSALISGALKRSERRKPADTKTIDGRECEDFKIAPTEPSAQPFSVCIDKSTRFPVELTTDDSDPAKQLQIKWTNLSPGPQAAVLFDPPLGYQMRK
jgi:hypothetical protein